MTMNNPSAIVYNAYINGLMKGGNSDKAKHILKTKEGLGLAQHGALSSASPK